MSTPTPSFCPVCGQPSPGGAIHEFHSGEPDASSKPAKKQSRPVLAWLVFLIVIGIGAYWVTNRGSSGGTTGADGAPPANPAGTKHLTGVFMSWEPVDDANGYAYFSITNGGTTTETAECMISVKNDFGDFGFDSLVGESVGPGETIRVKLPLSVGKGSYLINQGEVKDC